MSINENAKKAGIEAMHKAANDGIRMQLPFEHMANAFIEAYEAAKVAEQPVGVTDWEERHKEQRKEIAELRHRLRKWESQQPVGKTFEEWWEETNGGCDKHSAKFWFDNGSGAYVLELEAVKPEIFQEALREEFHNYGLNGIAMAVRLMARFKITGREGEKP